RRHLDVGQAGGDGPGAGLATGVRLGASGRRIIARADKLIVHSANPAGFVELHGDRLSIPDYPGNSLFNTLGNLRVNAVAGLLFVDFARSQALQLTGAV